MVDMESLAFEDLTIGQKWTSESRVITHNDILGFASLTGDHTPIHVDPEFAANTPFRQVIAHGLLGLSILAGLSSERPRTRTTALLDVHSWKFIKPILVGDQVTVETEVIDLKPHGRKHGEVHWHRKLYNQHGEIVQFGILVTLVEMREPLKRNRTREDAPHTQSLPNSTSSLLSDLSTLQS